MLSHMNKLLLYFTVFFSEFVYIIFLHLDNLSTGSDMRDIWNFDFTMKTDMAISFVHILEFEDFNLTCT